MTDLTWFAQLTTTATDLDATISQMLATLQREQSTVRRLQANLKVLLAQAEKVADEQATNEIAQEMIERLTATGQRQQYTLAQGLNLVISQTGVWRQLRLSREHALPSSLEIKICRNAFGVPAHVEPRWAAALGERRAVALVWLVDPASAA